MENIKLVLLFTLVLVATSWLSPRLFRLSRADSTAIEFEVIVRNINVGILLKASLFPASVVATAKLGDTVMFALLFYGSLQLMIAVVLIKYYSRSTQ